MRPRSCRLVLQGLQSFVAPVSVIVGLTALRMLCWYDYVTPTRARRNVRILNCR